MKKTVKARRDTTAATGHAHNNVTFAGSAVYLGSAMQLGRWLTTALYRTERRRFCNIVKLRIKWGYIKTTAKDLPVPNFSPL